MGLPFPAKKHVVATTLAMADTGCSSMIAGIGFAGDLGLCKRDLLPVDMMMRAANKTPMDIIGGILVEIKLDGAMSSDKSTRQVVYISTNASKVFLNQDACV